MLLVLKREDSRKREMHVVWVHIAQAASKCSGLVVQQSHKR